MPPPPPRTVTETLTAIEHFKRLGSRHLLKEMKIQSILLKYNMIFRDFQKDKPKTISEIHLIGVISS